MIFNYEPQITSLEIESVDKCLKDGIANPVHILKSEQLFQEKFKLSCALTSSGTASLHLALLALGIKPGDEVICPNITFASSWNTIEYVGAKPIFVDIDPKTWCIDVDKIQASLTKKTKAIMSVDLYGNSCDYQALRKICDKYNLRLIQDAAESLGAEYMGNSVLSYGDISCTSFNLNKIITSCGGGAVFSKDESLVESVKNLLNQSKLGAEYDYTGLGYNYRMGSVNAALLTPQLKRVEDILQRKKAIYRMYQNKLANPKITMQSDQLGCIPNYWAIVAKFESRLQRKLVQDELLKRGIEVKRVFKPASLINWINKKYNIQEMKNSTAIYDSSLMLPSSVSLSQESIRDICFAIKKALRE